ncbi:uncharacterized protein EI90DRAFT_3016587 [Cantharellus anzutake]|uniref:uncharacterized protein n=1 Tax=Cantharellus anzutake TaxID=1750568 RepID=UPI0019033999|nr:uncharacterized protein EI90DRAFT_3016587 [Cantharellus anzutake]KAF8330724.1 hypothetical protein EI90DRAFT_3016587 [Cantharellus anzutake]
MAQFARMTAQAAIVGLASEAHMHDSDLTNSGVAELRQNLTSGKAEKRQGSGAKASDQWRRQSDQKARGQMVKTKHGLGLPGMVHAQWVGCRSWLRWIWAGMLGCATLPISNRLDQRIIGIRGRRGLGDRTGSITGRNDGNGAANNGENSVVCTKSQIGVQGRTLQSHKPEGLWERCLSGGLSEERVRKGTYRQRVP